MNVQWSVFPLSESRTNRSNNNDVWELLRLSCRDCFERLKFFETDIPRSVFSLNGSRANKTNWWFAKISKRFSMNVWWVVPSLSESKANRSN